MGSIGGGGGLQTTAATDNRLSPKPPPSGPPVVESTYYADHALSPIPGPPPTAPAPPPPPTSGPPVMESTYFADHPIPAPAPPPIIVSTAVADHPPTSGPPSVPPPGSDQLHQENIQFSGAYSMWARIVTDPSGNPHEIDAKNSDAIMQLYKDLLQDPSFPTSEKDRLTTSYNQYGIGGLCPDLLNAANAAVQGANSGKSDIPFILPDGYRIDMHVLNNPPF